MGKWDLSAISYILLLHIEVGNKQRNKLVVMLMVKLVIKPWYMLWYKLRK